MSSSSSPLSLRREALREALLLTRDLLYRHRASEIPEGYVDDYIALNWLEWDGGWLRVTPTGENICRQLVKNLQ